MSLNGIAAVSGPALGAGLALAMINPLAGAFVLAAGAVGAGAIVTKLVKDHQEDKARHAADEQAMLDKAMEAYNRKPAARYKL